MTTSFITDASARNLSSDDFNGRLSLGDAILLTYPPRLLYVYRYASLYFCMCIDADDNELETLEIIHHFVEILDRYFGNVRHKLFSSFLLSANRN